MDLIGELGKVVLISWAGSGHQSSTCYQSAGLDLGTNVVLVARAGVKVFDGI